MSGSEPPKKDEPAGADPPPEGAPPAAPAKPRGGRFDDRTMVLTPIAPKQPEGAAPERKRTLEDPTMKHVATGPRPARTKFDDETMRAIAPVKAEPMAVKPPADETMRVVAPAVRPSVAPSR